MENKKFSIETIAVIIAGFGTLMLVYFAYSNRGGGEVGASFDQTLLSYPIVTSAPIDQVGLANAQTALRSAELQTQSEGWQSLLSYYLGIDTNRTNLEITGITIEGQKDIAHTVSDAQRFIAEQETAALINSAKENARALIEQSRYQYEMIHQQEKSKRTGSVAGVFKKIIGLF